MELEGLVLDPWAHRRRHDLLELLVPTYQELGGRYGAILKSVCSYAIGMDERFLPVLPGLLRRS
jgi:hypothetical protein